MGKTVGDDRLQRKPAGEPGAQKEHSDIWMTEIPCTECADKIACDGREIERRRYGAHGALTTPQASGEINGIGKLARGTHDEQHKSQRMMEWRYGDASQQRRNRR